MCSLHVRQPRQQVDVVRGQRAGDERCGWRSRPSRDHEPGAPGCEHESGDEHEVEREHRGPAEPENRRREQRLRDERLGIGERRRLGGEDVAVEEVQRIARQRVRHPRQDPGVQLRVGVVIERFAPWRAGDRPGVEDAEREKDRERVTGSHGRVEVRTFIERFKTHLHGWRRTGLPRLARRRHP